MEKEFLHNSVIVKSDLINKNSTFQKIVQSKNENLVNLISLTYTTNQESWSVMRQQGLAASFTFGLDCQATSPIAVHFPVSQFFF
jgi:choline kinase